MKRPKFLTAWLVLMLIFSVGITVDSLTYLPFIFLTKSYVSLVGIIAGFMQVWAMIQLLRWKKIGIRLLISSMVIVFLVTAINEFYLLSNVGQIIVSLLIVLAVNIFMLGILYLSIRPVWENFK
ncbi:MAG TPA: hypothetical protein VF189_01830 [Patescibacteria group bacterium]